MTHAVVDFFSGCGGTSLGLRQSGMTILAGIDNDPEAAETYRINFPEASFIERDIREVSISEIADILPRKTPLVFSGCAPCQPFSKQNRIQQGSDPRRFLLREFERFVLAIKPDYVIVENVPGLQRVGTRSPLQSFVSALRKSEYRVTWSILTASHFGVPQTRKRLVLIASLSAEVKMPKPTHGIGQAPFATVREWISDLPALAAGATDPLDEDHSAMALSELNVKRIVATPEGGGRESWPPELLLDCHSGHRGHSDVYGRLAWDRPASAMTTRCLSYSNGRFGHPEENRAVSLREAACLQTFPRHFKFTGHITSKGRQVGNAVPPMLSRRIGEEIQSSKKTSGS